MGARVSTFDMRVELVPPAWAVDALNALPAHQMVNNWRPCAMQDVLREEALAAFREFASTRSEVHNARQG